MNIDLADVVRLTCQAEEGNPVAKFVLAFLTGEREAVKVVSDEDWCPTSRDEVLSMDITISVVRHGGVVYIPSTSLWPWMRKYAIGRESRFTATRVWVYEYEGGAYRKTKEVWEVWG